MTCFQQTGHEADKICLKKDYNHGKINEISPSGISCAVELLF
ncbi:hypothetical protein HD_0622 [[Haemophilus] ducreyi 35000HP]|uniref:Uncharacterized protein n=1 Tax=Haemophilus ducreyi (strain 35000HP / ATCC 700724) TaxID=233412 RepID=Q7VND1_HAEDU|nr:hypothetical protein HD_0622 [[Haemophilus] ducreyi 35000HP]